MFTLPSKISLWMFKNKEQSCEIKQMPDLRHIADKKYLL
jgi:hypothetical protein